MDLALGSLLKPPLKLPTRLGCLVCAWDHLRPSGSGTSFFMSKYAPWRSMSSGTARGAVAAFRRGSDGLSASKYCRREPSSRMSSIDERWPRPVNPFTSPALPRAFRLFGLFRKLCAVTAAVAIRSTFCVGQTVLESQEPALRDRTSDHMDHMLGRQRGTEAIRCRM